MLENIALNTTDPRDMQKEGIVPFNLSDLPHLSVEYIIKRAQYYRASHVVVL